MVANNDPLPLSIGPIYGVLHIRDKDKKPLTWEFYVGGGMKYSHYGTSENELQKLPNYPITHRLLPSGIGVTLVHKKDRCLASFHGYDINNRYKHVHFYISSRGSNTWPNPKKNTADYRAFLSKVFGLKMGQSCHPVGVKFEFRKQNKIYIL